MNVQVATERRERNLEFFRRFMPDLHGLVSRHSPSSRLIFTDTGEPDIQTSGGLVYQGRLGEVVAGQLQRFWQAPKRFLIPPLKPGQFDKITNQFLDGLLKRADAEKIEFANAPTTPESYFLAVFGIGLGRHIDELVEKTDCRFLMIVDQGVDSLCHSLDTYDWHGLAARMEARGGALSFLIEDNPAAVSEYIIQCLGTVNPCSVDGFTYFIHDDTEFSGKVFDIVRRDQSLVLAGLGFFFDETLMLRNAYMNLRSGKSKVFHRDEDARLDGPVFVVASGPSLDASIPFIRDNADKAVIISSGSALRPLVKNGIMPDFHIEVENIAVLPLIAPVAEEHDLSSICLVAASTVDQEAQRFFGRTVYFFRPGLSPYPLLCDSDRNCLKFPDPTVVNASLSFALEVGFRDFYFFGVDLGTKGEGLHHSIDSYHYTDDPIVVPETLEFNIPLPGNFGGTSLTSEGLLLTRSVLTRAMRNYQDGYRYFNCSDGAMIEGAEPMLADTLSLPDVPGGKDKIIDGIIGGFPVYTSEKLNQAWDHQAFTRAIDDFIEDMAAQFQAGGIFPDRKYLTGLIKVLSPHQSEVTVEPTGVEKAVRLLFRGTIKMMVICVEHFLARVADRRKANAFAGIAAEEIIRTLEKLRTAALEIATDPETPSPTIMEDGSASEIIPELPYTFTNVARNAPCPCGSGKRFKKCHGIGQ